MGWEKIAGIIGQVAPLVGGILGGPIGMGVTVAARLLGSALGVEPEPEQIEAAIQANPEAMVRIHEMELQHKAELTKLYLEAQIQQMAQETQQIQTVNQTMQAEVRSEHWVQYSWRPFIGFCTGVAFLELVSLVGYLAYRAIISADSYSITMIPSLIMAFVPLFGIPGAILGVAAWHRGREKRAQLGDKPNLLVNLVGLLKKGS